MSQSVEAAYDETPYLSGPQPLSHPGHIGMLAQLHGLSSAPLENCRVLEIAGADGGNLLPLASDYPESSFCCIDLSKVQIEMGSNRARNLGLLNTEWIAADIADIDASQWNGFDYVIAHGVFSWVSSSVRDSLLRQIKQFLRPNGVAYVSFNTLPGWHAHHALREMVQRHVASIPNITDKVKASLELLQLIAVTDEPGNPITHLAQSFMAGLEGFEAIQPYVIHEFLSEDNSPIYFEEFSQLCDSHGLKVFCDADYPDKTPVGLPAEARNWIQAQNLDEVRLQQYLDYLRPSSFRRSLLCHQNSSCDASFAPQNWSSLFLSSDISRSDDEWHVHGGIRFKTGHEIANRLLEKLAHLWPESDRLERCAERLQVSVEELAHVVNSLFHNKILIARLSPPNCTRTIADEPLVSNHVREETSHVTTQYHRRIRIDDAFTRKLVSLLDGQNSVSQIAATTNRPLEDVQEHLETLRRHALLLRPRERG